jgi:surfactin synthase thioesterase subunit
VPQHFFVAASWAPHRERRLEDETVELSDEVLVPFCQRFAGLSSESVRDPAYLETVMPLFRADCELIRSSRDVPQTPMDLPISCLGGREDVAVTQEDLLEWQQLTSLPLHLRQFPGGHLFPQTERSAVLGFILETLKLPKAEETALAVGA